MPSSGPREARGVRVPPVENTFSSLCGRHLPAFNMQLTVVAVHDPPCPSTLHVSHKYMSPRGTSVLLTSNTTRLIGHLKSNETAV